MLEMNKTTNLQGTSKIDNTIVVIMNAQITDKGTADVTKTIVNKDIYNANKTECRKDIAEFEDKVYELEDSISNATEEE